MITSINEYKKKLDAVGKEDIDINNDGKVDKSDFFLLARRRKIKKEKENKGVKEQMTDTSNTAKAQNIFSVFNILTYLLDEGYITDALDMKYIDIEAIDADITQNLNVKPFGTLNSFESFINECKKYLSVAINENVSENSDNEYKPKFHDWQRWHDDKIEPAKSTIKMNLEKIWEITEKLDASLIEKKHFTTDILKINSDIKKITDSYPNL